MLFALSATCAVAAGEGWTVDFNSAKKTAAAEKKDLFLEFTGSDWCPPCKALASEIFDTVEFKRTAPNSFVLVRLDYPNNKSSQTEFEIAQNVRLAKEYSIRTYPTVLLADAKGRPYAAMAGYYRGTGIDNYMAKLEKLRKNRPARDEALAAAEKAEGVEKAKLLDQAVASFGLHADEKTLNPEERDRLAGLFYAKEIAEIIKLDANNEAGLKSKYETISRNAAVFNGLGEIQASGVGKEVKLAKVDALIESLGLTGELKQKALFAKMSIAARANSGQVNDEVLGFIEQAIAAAPQSAEGKKYSANLANYRKLAETNRAKNAEKK